MLRRGAGWIRERSHGAGGPARLPLLAAVALFLGSLGLAFPPLASGQPRDRSGERYVPGELLVRFERGSDRADRNSALDRVNARTREHFFVPRLRLVKIHGLSVPRAAARLERQRGVRYAEPNFIEEVDSIPNDTYFGSLWALNNTGQGVDGVVGTSNADIDAVEGWNWNRGSSSVIVGIADTGVFYSHPDLAPNIYKNPGESGGGKETNGVDDDGNGYVDDFRGWDFYGNDNDPAPASPITDSKQTHGTRVASAAGAQGDNNLGVTGSAQEVSLLPLRVGNTGSFVSAQISAYGYAKARGAKVVNLSAGGPTFSQARLDAIRAAPNVLFVFAAGNDGTNDNVTPQYPCHHNEPNVVCVAATDQNDNLASFSNYGTNAVDLAAPGVNILTATVGTDPASSYFFSDGTSFSSPITAGAAAVYRSEYPWATAADTRKALREGVDALPSLSNRLETDGRLNLAGTLSVLPPPNTAITSGPKGLTNDNDPSFTFSSTESVWGSFECRLDGAGWSSCTSPRSYSNVSDGSHTFRVRARNAYGDLDPTPAARSFTIDTAPPNTTITSGPSGLINHSSASFGFSASEAGSSFQCRLDSGGWSGCSSPKSYAGLAQGAHVFRVRAKDAAGNLDPTPASRIFIVDTLPPNTTITFGPTGPTNDATPTFGFAASESGSKFKCRIDGAPFASCASPKTLGPLADGPHSFAVRAIDRAANADPTPASRSFTVDTKVAAKIRIPKAQRQRHKVKVKAMAKANEGLFASATGKVEVAHKDFKLKPVGRQIDAGERATLALRAKRHRDDRKIMRALKRGEKVKAIVKLRLGDGVGNAKKRKQTVELKRR